MKTFGRAIAVGLVAGTPALAGEVEIVGAEATLEGNGTYGFSVTLRHADKGWEHYADRWTVLTPDGAVLGERVLLHPHDSEQPFTRGLSGVRIPEDLARVRISAHDKVHGDSPELLQIDLPGR